MKYVDTSTMPAGVTLEQARPILEMALKEAKKQIDAEGGLKSIKVVDTKIADDGNSAVVTLSIESGKKTNTAPMSLKKVDGKWKVAP